MPRFELKWKRQAQRDLRSLGKTEADRIRRALESKLAADPHCGEPLRGLGRPMWRFRVGDYRVPYVFNDEEVWILVLRVAHRSTAYRDL